MLVLLIKSSFSATAKLSCYPQYSANGCMTCHSHDQTIDCGYCGSVMSCLPGGPEGSTDKRCDNNTWIYSEQYCDDNFCSKFKTRRDCKYPCAYSWIHGCVYNVEYQLHASQLTLFALIFVCVVFGVILVIVIIWACCWWKRYDCSSTCYEMMKRNYVLVPVKELNRMQNINLDDIPDPSHFPVELDSTDSASE